MEVATKSLYENLGGDDAVSAVVDEFYVQLLMDNRVKHFFDGYDIARLKSHQKGFLKAAFGGIKLDQKVLERLSIAHKPLVEKYKLDDSHFNATAEILVNVLKGFSVAQQYIDQVVEIVEGTRKYVLCKS